MAAIYDNVLEHEEYISPEEYLKRRSEGAINPGDVRYAANNPVTGEPGGFWVKLPVPRYRPTLKPQPLETSHIF